MKELNFSRYWILINFNLNFKNEAVENNSFSVKYKGKF